VDKMSNVYRYSANINFSTAQQIAECCYRNRVDSPKYGSHQPKCFTSDCRGVFSAQSPIPPDIYPTKPLVPTEQLPDMEPRPQESTSLNLKKIKDLSQDDQTREQAHLRVPFTTSRLFFFNFSRMFCAQKWFNRTKSRARLPLWLAFNFGWLGSIHLKLQKEILRTVI